MNSLTVLSLLDNRSRPKGSRDPLGAEAIWSSMGRRLVGNLTTVTGNLDNFMVALLCCQHANQQADQTEQIQDAFMRAEQLAAYLQLASDKDSAFLGITRASSNFKQDELPLGRSEAAQILSNQLSYGLWGLYSTAMQVAGLIKGSDRQPTEAGLELIEALIDRLGSDHWQRFVELAGTDSVRRTDVEGLASAFQMMMTDPNLRSLVVSALLNSERAPDLQRELYQSASEYLAGLGEGDEAGAHKFCLWLLEQRDTSAEMCETVQQILALEPLLVLSSTLIDWLQGEKQSRRDELVEALQTRLGSLNEGYWNDAWMRANKLPHRQFLLDLFQAAQNADAAALIDVVMEQNKQVMLKRGGAPWVEWQADQLRVRMPYDRASLPDDLSHFCRERWNNNYFIGSFLRIAREVN